MLHSIQRSISCFALLRGSRQPLLCGHTNPFLLSNICGSIVFIGTFLCASSKKYNKAVGVCWEKISKLRLPVSVVCSRAMEEIKVWQSCIFRAIFSLRGAFMLCNVWNDVLASFQHSNYKFCLRCEGQISLKHTRDTRKEKNIFFKCIRSPPTNPSFKEEQSYEPFVTFQGHFCLRIGAVTITPPVHEGTEVRVKVTPKLFPGNPTEHQGCSISPQR